MPFATVDFDSWVCTPDPCSYWLLAGLRGKTNAQPWSAIIAGKDGWLPPRSVVIGPIECGQLTLYKAALFPNTGLTWIDVPKLIS